MDGAQSGPEPGGTAGPREKSGAAPGQWRAVAAALADRRRLLLYARIVSGAAEGAPVQPDALDRDGRKSLAALQKAGLVVAGPEGVEPAAGLFAELLLSGAPVPETSARRFLVKGRIESFPRRRADRLELLHLMAGEIFENAPHPEAGPPLLDERELTRRLGRYSADPVGLRRHLVDEGIVTRDAEGRRYRLARPRPAEGMDYA